MPPTTSPDDNGAILSANRACRCRPSRRLGQGRGPGALVRQLEGPDDCTEADLHQIAQAKITNEAKRLLKTRQIVLSQIAKAKRSMKTRDL